MLKTCFKCELPKERDTEFYKHPQMGDGYLGKCKECAKKDSNTRRANKLELIKAYDRKRGLQPHRKEKVRLYQKNHSDKHVEANRQYYEKNPEKVAAHFAVNNAVRDGRLIKKPCEVCGEEKSQGHHDDYTKPLEVRWLCSYHHGEHHRLKNERERQEVTWL